MIFEFEGFSREVDNMEVGVVRRYEKSLEDFYRRVAAIDMKGSASGIYAEICEAGEDMMNSFFGEGAAKEMFGEGQSVRKVMAAVCGLNSYMNDVGSVVDSMRRLGA